MLIIFASALGMDWNPQADFFKSLITVPSTATVDTTAHAITVYGGSPGIRDRGLLESALAQPRLQIDGHFLHQAIHDMATAYLFHLIKNHPFIDGNKRIGAATCMIFLDQNNQERAAESRITKAEIAAILKRN